MEIVMGVWPGNNGNGYFMGTIDTEEVCGLDGDRVGGVRLCIKDSWYWDGEKSRDAGQWRWWFVFS